MTVVRTPLSQLYGRSLQASGPASTTRGRQPAASLPPKVHAVNHQHARSDDFEAVCPGVLTASSCVLLAGLALSAAAAALEVVGTPSPRSTIARWKRLSRQGTVGWSGMHYPIRSAAVAPGVGWS